MAWRDRWARPRLTVTPGAAALDVSALRGAWPEGYLAARGLKTVLGWQCLGAELLLHGYAIPAGLEPLVRELVAIGWRAGAADPESDGSLDDAVSAAMAYTHARAGGA